MVNKCLAAIAVFLCASTPGIADDFSVGRSRVNASVFKKLAKGVNVDTAHPDAGVWPKIQHDRAHFQAAADAGFDSVRVMIPFNANYESIQKQIKDALSNDLAIVVNDLDLRPRFVQSIPATEGRGKRHRATGLYREKMRHDLSVALI